MANENSSGDNSASSADQIYAEQVNLLYTSAPVAHIVTLINGAILIFIQRPYFPTHVLITWYGCLVAVTAMRAFSVWRYSRDKPRVEEATGWNLIYLVGTGLAATIWGAAAWMLFPAASTSNQIFVAFVLAGMAAASVSVLAARLEVCLMYLLPVLLPLAFHYFLINTTLHLAMGLMTMLFVGGLVVSAMNFHRSIRTSLVLRFDKRELEQEIAQRLRAEEALFLEKERLQTVLKSIGEGVALVDANGRIEYLNDVAEQICGCSCADAVNRAASDVFESYDIEQHQRIPTAMEDSLHAPNQIKKQTAVFYKGGEKHFIEELATPLYDLESKLVGAVSILRDVTEAHRKTEQLVHAANHDALTGLPNRSLLNDRTRQAIARAQRKQEHFALLFLDLDSFKAINDNLGHASGDALLVNVAKRLGDCVRKEDTIARLGGDEFVVLLDGPTKPNEINAIADKIHHTLREPYQLAGQSTIVNVSIGASVYPDDGEDPDSLLMHADLAMYRAKQQHGRPASGYRH
jgi:diguanylate cyclase (GGDEF)-like protein/PAS domain S-box-containing protein